ncbi:MAG: HPP family protein [Candidatus Anammoxibacter sp.]
MKIFDEKFKANKVKYVLQCALATVVVSVILIVLSSVADTVIVAALGASAFIAFAMPQKEVSSPRFLIGGYLIGTTVGCGCHFLSEHYLLAQMSLEHPGYYLLTHISFINEYSRQIFGSISVGTAIFLMTITDTEHPPAAGLALGFVLNGWSYITIEVVLAGIVLISLIKFMLRRLLINLV